jgi:hypothetical protein
VKDRTPEQTPSRVPATAPQGGEIRARWAWVEPVVWTERILATLETGIEGGKWFRLIDKVWSPKNLESSLQKVVAKGGLQTPHQKCHHPAGTISTCPRRSVRSRGQKRGRSYSRPSQAARSCPGSILTCWANTISRTKSSRIRSGSSPQN